MTEAIEASEAELWRPHIKGLLRSLILVTRCDCCDQMVWPPRLTCPNCLAGEFSWVPAPLRGSVYTYTVCYRPFHEWFAERVPYAIVVVELAEGVRVVGACLGDTALLECGKEVRADFSIRCGLHDLPVLSWLPTA